MELINKPNPYPEYPNSIDLPFTKDNASFYLYTIEQALNLLLDLHSWPSFKHGFLYHYVTSRPFRLLMRKSSSSFSLEQTNTYFNQKEFKFYLRRVLITSIRMHLSEEESQSFLFKSPVSQELPNVTFPCLGFLVGQTSSPIVHVKVTSYLLETLEDLNKLKEESSHLYILYLKR